MIFKKEKEKANALWQNCQMLEERQWTHDREMTVWHIHGKREKQAGCETGLGYMRSKMFFRDGAMFDV